MVARIALLSVSVFCAVAALAPAAQAGDYCVGVSEPRCPVSGYGPATPTLSGIFDAIDAANNHAGPDTVVIAPGTMAYETVAHFSPKTDTEILGAGAGQTVFSSDFGSPSAVRFWFGGAGDGKVSGISVNVVDESATGNGLSIKNGTVSDFSVAKSQDGFSAGFVSLDLVEDASANNGTIEHNSYAGVGVNFGPGASEFHHMDVSGPNGGVSVGLYARTAGSIVNAHHLKVNGFATHVGVEKGSFTLTDSVLDLGSSYGVYGFSASAGASTSVDVDIARVTVVGSGTNQGGFYLWAEDSPASLEVDLFDFVAFGQFATFQTIYCAGGAGAPQPVDLEIERFAAIGGNWSINSGCSWDFESDKYVDLLNEDPGFVNAAAGDFRLLRTSPLIDEGDTTGTLGSSATDYSDSKRVVDGDGDGIAKVDLGAFEYQRSPPEIAITQSASTALPGQAVSFGVSGSDPEGEPFTYAWSFSDGGSAGDVAGVSHAFMSPGANTATVTATDAAGASASATAVVVVSSPPKPATATATITAKAKKAFKRGKTGFAPAKKGAPSFTVVFTDTARARLTLQSIGKNKKLKKVKGETLFRVNSATTKFGFGGKFGGKKLKAGKYRVTITPLAADGTAGTPVTVDLTLK